MKSFAYARAESVREARELLGSPGARLLMGGTDLLTLLKERLVEPERLVDLGGAASLRGISLDGERLRIGALTTLAELERHDATPGVIRDALADAATPQLRNVATVGGNLLQRNRCWYFRSEAHRCWLKGGSACLAVEGDGRYHAIFGEGECRMVTPSDLAPALMALDATVGVDVDGDERRLPVASLYAVPTERRREEHAVGSRDVITFVEIARDALARHGTYLKFMDRATWAFAVVSVAASAVVINRRVQDVRLVAAAVASVPWRVREAEELLEGERVDENSARAAAERFVRDALPLKDNGYKVEILRELVRRSLLLLV